MAEAICFLLVVALPLVFCVLARRPSRRSDRMTGLAFGGPVFVFYWIGFYLFLNVLILAHPAWFLRGYPG